MRIRSVVLLAAALSFPLSVLTASGASAAEEPVSRVVLDDATGDVWATGDGEDDAYVSAGDVPSADVVRAVVRHGRHNVVTRLTFTDLRRDEPQSYSAAILGRRQYAAVFVSAGPGAWRGRHMLVDGGYSRVRCTGLRHGIDYDLEQVTVSVPRGCIGGPDWVRVGMANYMFRAGTGEDFQEITDNPHSADADGSFTRRLHRTAR